jgi:exosortase/archaeosortase family protein
MDFWERFEQMRPEGVNRRHWDMLTFLVRLSALAIPMYAILSVPGILIPLQMLTADVVSWVLRTMGMELAREGTLLSVPGFSFMIDADCTGWKSVMFLFALIFAFRGPGTGERLRGLTAGSIAILMFNIVRITGSVLAQGVYGTGFALFLHDWVFRYAMVAVVLLSWTAWMLFYLNRKTKLKHEH